MDILPGVSDPGRVWHGRVADGTGCKRETTQGASNGWHSNLGGPPGLC